MADIPQAVHRLIPDAQYHDASSYARLQATWFDSRTIPTEAAVTAEISAIDSEADTAQQQANAILLDIRTRLQDIGGTAIDDLTNPNLRDLLFALLFETGAIDRATATIKDPAEWVTKPEA